jgi:two-component system, NtrC family, sensor kinase
MRKFYFSALLLLFIVAKTFAQTGQVFNLNKLSKRDTLLSGWKFQAGDNPQWANPAFDDSKWQAVDPGQDITTFEQLKTAGTGWLRLHIKTDSAIARQQIMAWVSQYSASEIYLDGKLIRKYGYISDNPAKTIAVNPARKPFRLRLKGGTDEVIAVRLGYQSSVLYSSPLFDTLPAFSMYINGKDEQDSYDNLSQNLLITTAIATGIFLVFCFVYLIYFLFDRSRKSNLYFAIYCFCIFGVCANDIFIFNQNHTDNLSAQMWVYFFGGMFFCIAFLFFVLVIYELFHYRLRLIFKLLIVLALATQATYLLGDIINGLAVSVVFPVICTFEVARVCVLAAKQGKKQAVTILIFTVLFAAAYVWGAFLNQTSLLANVINFAFFMGFPIGMSVYLAIKTAVTNRHLKTTLAEVQILSAQKQQILADQNIVLEQQVTERTAELNQSLTHLKATQTQLIQSEKMASLGELTAGIAHEIQNPLNFVNNFSDVNREMIDELREELKGGNVDEAIAIIDDIQQNEEKINHHGKRADAIVKGMLQHSKSGSGVKEPTSVNALADEYMRLSYHGLRSKDKSFNAGLVTNFDEKLPKVNVIPQDIGRVLLNLFNNAFYAVSQKQKAADTDYKPEVSVTTSSANGQVIINVKDNGTGIPDAIKEKVMQPFFTTKPTGEGTGLGLSLTYDMVVKGHGGKIDINTKEGEFTEFIITLPIG